MKCGKDVTYIGPCGLASDHEGLCISGGIAEHNEIVRLRGKLRECVPLGSWMSAALDDPKVCQEMKDAINRFLPAIHEFVGE